MGTLLERLLALDFGRLMGVVVGGGFHSLAKRPARGHRLRHVAESIPEEGSEAGCPGPSAARSRRVTGEF